MISNEIREAEKSFFEKVFYTNKELFILSDLTKIRDERFLVEILKLGFLRFMAVFGKKSLRTTFLKIIEKNCPKIVLRPIFESAKNEVCEECRKVLVCIFSLINLSS